MITAEERKAICEAREFKDELLRFWKARIIRNLQVRRAVRIILMKIIFIWKEFMSVMIAVVTADIAPRK